MRANGYSPGKERGIAVISAMLIAALVASLAFALSARERLWLNQMANRQDLAAAQSVAFSAIDLARLTLRDDMRNNRIDQLLESWTVPIPPISVEEGKASGRLIELQGRFNLFNLQSGGTPNDSALASLRTLLAGRNLPPEWADRMAVALARQVALRQEDSASAKVLAPRRLADKLLPVANLSELANLSGIDPAKLSPLEPLLTLLPESTSVNVNFAAPELLVAITPLLSLGEAEEIVSRRASAPFKSTQDYLNALPQRLRSQSAASSYCVESQFFLSEVDSWFGRAHLRLQALIYRQRNQMPEVLWVRRI